jgi:hypothetical protein
LRGAIAAAVFALLLLPVFSLSLGSPDPDPGRTFTIEADRITLRSTSSLLELLAGDIKAENVTMENVTVSYGSRTMSFPWGHTDSMEAHVTFLSLLGVAITNFEDLIHMLLGKTVTLEKVYMKAYSSSMSSLDFRSLEVEA